MTVKVLAAFLNVCQHNLIRGVRDVKQTRTSDNDETVRTPTPFSHVMFLSTSSIDGLASTEGRYHSDIIDKKKPQQKHKHQFYNPAHYDLSAAPCCLYFFYNLFTHHNPGEGGGGGVELSTFLISTHIVGGQCCNQTWE